MSRGHERTQSPYLSEPDRLADVIAAIQALGSYKFYKLTFARWSERISGSEDDAAHWERVFKDHPEFFRLDGDRAKASLVWRRQFPRRFDVDAGKIITAADDARDGDHDDIEATRANLRAVDERLSREPLSSDEIKILIDAAIDLHSRALEAKKESRWWFPLMVAVLAAVASFSGAVLAAFIKGG
jgi:hypothetical protein